MSVLASVILRRRSCTILSVRELSYVNNGSLLACPAQEEISIPVPWGRVAAKRWGNRDGRPVLCIHGWLDNSCSFDGLAAGLPATGHDFVALDLPGHGFSDHFLPGMTYRFSDGFTVIRHVQHFLGWEKSAIVGHSLGAAISAWFAAIFPEHVDRLVCLDLINVGPLTVEKHAKLTKKSILTGMEVFRKLADDRPPPSYSYEDAVARAFMANQMAHGEGSISQASVETLMRRGLRKTEDGKFSYTADLRLRIPAAFHVLVEQVEHYAASIKSPMLLLKSSESPYYMSEEMARRILKVYINHNANFEAKKVEGGHHVHLNNPERVSGHIGDFLSRDKFAGEAGEDSENQENFPLDLF